MRISNTTNAIADGISCQCAGLSSAYLNKPEVSADDVRQSPLNVVGVRGTPTLILVDDKGLVTGSWFGKLSAERELEALTANKQVLFIHTVGDINRSFLASSNSGFGP